MQCSEVLVPGRTGAFEALPFAFAFALALAIALPFAALFFFSFFLPSSTSFSLASGFSPSPSSSSSSGSSNGCPSPLISCRCKPVVIHRCRVCRPTPMRVAHDAMLASSTAICASKDDSELLNCECSRRDGGSGVLVLVVVEAAGAAELLAL